MKALVPAGAPALAALFATLILGGCSDDARCPSLPGGPDYCLQASTDLPPFHALQDIRVRRESLDERFIAQLEVDAEGMRLAGLSPMGQKLLEARFDNRSASAESLAGGQVDARALLSLIQMALWPAHSVRAGLGESWELQEDTNHRRILREGETLVLINRVADEGERVISLPKAGLRIDVRDVKE